MTRPLPTAKTLRLPAGPARDPSHSLARCRPCLAFTLFELLLAVAVFSLVLLAIHTVFFSALSLRNKTTVQLENSRPTYLALEILKRDLANLVPPGGTFSGPFQSARLRGNLGQSGSNSTNSPPAVLPGRVVSPDLYTTTGIVNDLDPWGEILRVTYYLADPAGNLPGKDLVRSVTRNHLPLVEDPAEDQWLLGKVNDVVFLFFDGQSWLEDWDSTTAATPLPAAVKLQLWTATGPLLPPSEPIELVVPLVVKGSTNQTESASGGGA